MAFTSDIAAASETADRAARFLELHRGDEPLLLPNPWDAGSARILAWVGYDALATTSSGFAATLGRLDGSVNRPVNVLLLAGGPTVAELAELGVHRISIGGALAFAALGGLVEAARDLREQCTGTYPAGRNRDQLEAQLGVGVPMDPLEPERFGEADPPGRGRLDRAEVLHEEHRWLVHPRPQHPVDPGGELGCRLEPAVPAQCEHADRRPVEEHGLGGRHGPGELTLSLQVDDGLDEAGLLPRCRVAECEPRAMPSVAASSTTPKPLRSSSRKSAVFPAPGHR